ncbi:MAG: XdhC family protein [Chloroflexota bacterium]|nr:XdhC family protein [Chloroflexota bacterium]
MEILGSLNQAIESRQPVALCLIVKTNISVSRHVGSKMIVYEDGRTQGSIGRGSIEEGIRYEAEVKRIKSPIGLPINAETPKGIAVSVLAEIIAQCNHGIWSYRKEFLERSI